MIRTQRREETIRIAADGEAGQQQFRHRDLEVRGARRVRNAVETEHGAGVVVLHVNEVENVTHAVDHRQVRARRATVRLITHLHIERFRRHRQDEIIAEARLQRA